MALAAWIRETYGSTMINAIKTVLPVKKTIRQISEKAVVLQKTVDRERIEACKAQYQKKHAHAKLRLLKELEEENSLSMETVKERLHISAQTLKSHGAGRCNFCCKPGKNTGKQETMILMKIFI